MFTYTPMRAAGTGLECGVGVGVGGKKWKKGEGGEEGEDEGGEEREKKGFLGFGLGIIIGTLNQPPPPPPPIQNIN